MKMDAFGAILSPIRITDNGIGIGKTFGDVDLSVGIHRNPDGTFRPHLGASLDCGGRSKIGAGLSFDSDWTPTTSVHGSVGNVSAYGSLKHGKQKTEYGGGLRADICGKAQIGASCHRGTGENMVYDVDTSVPIPNTPVSAKCNFHLHVDDNGPSFGEELSWCVVSMKQLTTKTSISLKHDKRGTTSGVEVSADIEDKVGIALFGERKPDGSREWGLRPTKPAKNGTTPASVKQACDGSNGGDICGSYENGKKNGSIRVSGQRHLDGSYGDGSHEGKMSRSEDGLTDRALRLMRTGVMPLLPPACREWNEDMVCTFTNGLNEVVWPPKAWKQMSPTKRLAAWRSAAMKLVEDESGVPALPECILMDTFNMLALPGTEPHKAQSPAEKSRRYLYEQLRQIITTGQGDTGIIESLERASPESRMTDCIVQLIEGHNIPVRIAPRE